MCQLLIDQQLDLKSNMSTKQRNKPDSGLEVPGSDAPLDQLVTYRLSRLYHTMNAQALEVLEKTSGIGIGQWRVLAMLGSERIRTSKELCANMKLDRAFISRTLRSLESEKLVRTERPESNRRILNVELTKKGREIYEKTLPVMRQRHGVLMASLDQNEQQVVFDIIDKLEQAAQIRDFSHEPA